MGDIDPQRVNVAFPPLNRTSQRRLSGAGSTCSHACRRARSKISAEALCAGRAAGSAHREGSAPARRPVPCPGRTSPGTHTDRPAVCAKSRGLRGKAGMDPADVVAGDKAPEPGLELLQDRVRSSRWRSTARAQRRSSSPWPGSRSKALPFRPRAMPVRPQNDAAKAATILIHANENVDSIRTSRIEFERAGQENQSLRGDSESRSFRTLTIPNCLPAERNG